jgi:hypothetical protein
MARFPDPLAGIGALAGAGGGALTQLFTWGKQISVPAETTLTFRLEQTSPALVSSAGAHHTRVFQGMLLRVERRGVQLHHALHGRIRLLHMTLGMQGAGEQLKGSRVLRIDIYGLAE